MKKVLLLVTLLLVGCSGVPGFTPSTATSTLTPTPTEIPATATPLPPIVPEAVSFTGYEELEIIGELYMPRDASSPRPALLALHMNRGNKREWKDVAPQLAEAGYVVLAIDMRGSGVTGGRKDWQLAEEDHKLAVEFLANVPGVDADRIGVMGGSIGANMTMVVGAADENVRVVILLSPGLDTFGVTTADKLPAYGDRPMMIVASDNDNQAADNAETLASQAIGETELVIYENAGHGTRMFGAKPELIEAIIEWLNNNL